MVHWTTPTSRYSPITHKTRTSRVPQRQNYADLIIAAHLPHQFVPTEYRFKSRLSIQ